MKPIMKRQKTGMYIVKKEKILSLYQVNLIYPDGRRKVFASEEHANAFLEDRPVNFGVPEIAQHMKASATTK